MRITISKNAREQGSLLLVALMVAGIAGVTLGSYLLMTQQQNVSIYRSQVWNTSIVITEAGIEDGLALINRYAGTLEPNILPTWTNTASSEGWSSPATDVYYTRRYLRETVTSGTLVNYYDVWVFNTNKSSPTVLAVGTVPWTYMTASAETTPPLFASYSSSSTEGTTTATLARKVGVKTQYDPLFVVAMAATDRINLNGNSIATDSFDSSLPAFSTNGFYPYGHPEMTRDHGDVATTSAIIDVLNLGNANIRGHVRTGPGTNTIYIGSQGSVGDRSHVANVRGEIQNGWSSTDFNVAFPSVTWPTNASWFAPNYTDTVVDGRNYQYVIDQPGDYYIPPGYPLVRSMYITGPTNSIVRIAITTPVSLSGQEVIRIANTGVKVRIYMAGSSFTLGGQSFIDNMSGRAENFYLFGLPSLRDINWAGNAAFYGGVYCPQAAFNLGGGGSDWWDFVGASVTRTVTMTGHYRFHFDENLARIGPSRGYVPVAWKEL